MRTSSPSSLTAWQMAAAQRKARAVPDILGVCILQADYTGPDIIHAGMHMEVQSGLAIDEANRIAEDRILVTASPTWMRRDQIQDLY